MSCLRNAIRSINIIRRIKKSGHIAGVGEIRKAYKILLGKQRYNFDDLSADVSILIHWVFQT
jgi:hypothetical protein